MKYLSAGLVVIAVFVGGCLSAPGKTKLSLLVHDFNSSNIPGIPGKDYPVMRDIPLTSFSCNKIPPGFYADYETRCQVFHMCDDDKKSFTFLCPNGTVFNEKRIKCDLWHKVSCKTSQTLVNLLFPLMNKGKNLANGGQMVAQDRTLDLVDSISDLIKYSRRKNQEDLEDEDSGGSRFRYIMRRVIRILTGGF